jgi:16S rRNA (cytidine1402-2'-O)-methyltransferase
MDAGRWVFEGFLPTDRKQRSQRLAQMTREPRMMVLYEAPHRLLQTLEELRDALGDRGAVLCNDLTKRFEKTWEGSLSSILEEIGESPVQGEYVLVLEAVEPEPERADWQDLTVSQHVQTLMIRGLDRMGAIKEVARLRGQPKSDIYRQFIDEQGEED